MSDDSWVEGGEKMNANQPHKWACLANQECRANKTVINIHAKSAQQATTHLSDVHGVISAVTKAKKETKDQENAKVQQEKIHHVMHQNRRSSC